MGMGARSDGLFPTPRKWRIAGQQLSNTRDQPVEHLIRSNNVGKLNPRRVFTTGSDVSATPTVAEAT